MKRILGVCLVALLGPSTVPSGVSAQEVNPAEQYHLRAEYWQWRPVLDSSIQKGSGGETGTLLDPASDLGIGDKRTYELTAVLQISPGHKLRGSYTPLSYKGDLSAPRTFTFGATTYNEAERVVSSLKGAYYTGEYEFDIVKTREGYLGGLVGAKFFDMDSVLVAPDAGHRESDTERIPIPILGATARVYMGRLSLAGEISGLTIGKRGHVFEIQGSAGLHVSDRLAIQAGYRRLTFHAVDGLDLFDLDLRGWAFGLQLSL